MNEQDAMQMTMDTALRIIAETRSYVQDTRDTGFLAHKDHVRLRHPWSGYSDDEALLSALHDADDLLRRIDELMAAIPH